MRIAFYLCGVKVTVRGCYEIVVVMVDLFCFYLLPYDDYLFDRFEFEHLLLFSLSLIFLIFLFYCLKYTLSPNLSNCPNNTFFFPNNTNLHMLIFFTVIFKFSLNLKNFPDYDLKFYKCYVF